MNSKILFHFPRISSKTIDNKIEDTKNHLFIILMIFVTVDIESTESRLYLKLIFFHKTIQFYFLTKIIYLKKGWSTGYT
jgi:hypothetical protein